MSEQDMSMETLTENQELDHAIAEASGRIEQRMEDTAAQTTDAAKELGFVQAVWEASKEGRDELIGLTWKNAKGVVAAGLSLVPLASTLTNVGKAAEAGRAVGASAKAIKSGEWFNSMFNAATGKEAVGILVEPLKKTKDFIGALGKVPVSPFHKVKQPLGAVAEVAGAVKDYKGKVNALNAMKQTVSKVEFLASHQGEVNSAKEALKASAKKGALSVGLRGAEWAMNTFDPYPDVPGPIVGIFAVAGLVLPGAEIVPAAWQLIHNQIEWSKTVGKMGLAVGEVVANRLNRDYVQVKAPKVEQAAGVFA